MNLARRQKDTHNEVYREIMDIFAAYDLMGSTRGAVKLAQVSHHTVKRYITKRDQGIPVAVRKSLVKKIDPYLPIIEELIESSKGDIRANIVYEKIQKMGYTGAYRTAAHWIAKEKMRYKARHQRVHRPWITKPGKWLQYDFGDGPIVDGVKTVLFVAWLAWSKFWVVIPLRDRQVPSIITALDQTFRFIGGIPTYVLSDNAQDVGYSNGRPVDASCTCVSDQW